MGAIHSVPDTHIRIYKNLFSIRSTETRIQMIETLLASAEHVSSMKQAGIYGQLLHYIQQVKSGKAALLPGERETLQQSSAIPVQAAKTKKNPSYNLTTTNEKSGEKALNYFSACLRILELEEEVSLTDTTLKKAYRKAALRSHPDKGGSEKEFEAVTRAFAYLGEIIQRIHGGRSSEGKVEAPTVLSGHRSNASEKWKMVEPISLNPDKLDLNTFNTMFEKTRIPDPDDNGYGDWLKGEQETSSSVKFGGKFNRDVFHRAFEDEQSKKGPANRGGAIVAQELSMASRMGYGVEIGRTGHDDYTVSANDVGLQFTDLKKAYTDYTTFSQNTKGIHIQQKNLEDYTTERKNTPTALTDHERTAIYAAEKMQLQAEEKRKKRLAEEAMAEGDYFQRMQRLVIRN